MPRIFDNIEQALLPALQETLDRSDRADFCVGYFNLRDWKQLDASVERWAGGDGHCCRMMVGMQRPPDDELHKFVSLVRHDAEMDQPTAVRLRRKLALEFREQLAGGVPTDEDEAGLRRLASQIRARKVVVKLFLRHPLHAKLYLLFRPDPVAPSVGFPIGILSFDHAGNNVRNLSHALQVLRRYPNLSYKETSELHLLGFLSGGTLTTLGMQAKACKSETSLARIWCRWLATRSYAELEKVNPRLASFRRAAIQFWKLRGEVSRFFLNNVDSRGEQATLQTVELLCNGSGVVEELSLDQIKTLTGVLENVDRLTSFLAKRVREYRDNKGSRGWGSYDRRTILIAWRYVTRGRRARD